jgi:Cu(I)/Ag(I) efflux system membrane protein CusA/SilA
MRRIAAPMVGGVVTSFASELVVFPAVYFLWRALQWRRRQEVLPEALATPNFES